MSDGLSDSQKEFESYIEVVQAVNVLAERVLKWPVDMRKHAYKKIQRMIEIEVENQELRR